MHITIIDCGAGNLHSVRKAFARVMPADATLEVTTQARALDQSTHLVLPGVGAFADCMAGLEKLPGLRDALEKRVLHGKTPFLGICVGMQMLFERGYEHGMHQGLGWFKGEVAKIAPSDASLRIPHMGWNTLRVRRDIRFTSGIQNGDSVYFVHSYAVQHALEDIVVADVDYGGRVVALVGRDNIVATQFHPEKSQRVGLQLIRNFLDMNVS
jgi:glutamine amidotransferase